jgi:hypothetical protein
MQITGTVHISRRLGGLSARELAEWVEHPATTAFFARLDYMIDDARKACEAGKDLDEWRRAQGALEALRRAKTIPDILKSEMKDDTTK